ncbi:transcription factor mef2A-like [Panonychus citri]|uniref:transcription factor mef2A-like n=1 Tax=Panonychus citri TaxID=50023 RepID=UPI0023074D53|nr:transcription factor mef2A-like [Panonychus citri]
MNITHSPAIAITFRCNCSQPLHARTIGFLADWISAYVFIKGNKERLVLYFLVSFLGTFLIIFLVLSIRLYVQKRRAIRLLKETAPLVSPISDISYEVHRDTTLDPLDISVPTSQTTLNHGPNHGHHQHQHSLHHHQQHHPSSRLPSALTSIVTGPGGGHTQTHLDSQYQPLLTSPRHHNHHHRSSSSRQDSPQTSHSVSQSPQQSPQRLSLLQPDSSQQPNTSTNSSNNNSSNTNGNNSNLIVNSNENSPVNSNVDNLINPSIDESQRLYSPVPSSSQRRSTRESSSPRTINSSPSTDANNSPRPASIGSNNQPNQRANSIARQQQSNEMIIGYS